MLHTVAILKFTAVVHRDSLKSTVGELGNNSIQGRGSSCCSLAAGPYNDLKACQAFGEDKERLPLAFCGAYDTVHFPMAKGQAVINMGWTAVYGKPLRCPGGLYLAGLALLTAGLLREVLICYAGDIAPVYVTIQSGGADCPFPGSFLLVYNNVDGDSMLDLLGNICGETVVVAQLYLCAL